MKTKQEEINELRERLDALEKELKKESNGRWKPEINEFYYTINACNYSVTTRYDDYSLDNQRYETFNMFQTKEEAEKIAKYQLIFRKLYDFAKRNNGEFDNGLWFEITLAVDTDELVPLEMFIANSGCVMFSSEEVAQKAIEYIGESDMKWYLTFQV